MKVKTKKKAYDALQKILDFSSEKDKRIFSEMVMSTDAMFYVRDFMEKNSIDIKQMSKLLKISQKQFIELNTGDKYVTIELLVKIQKILNVRMVIVPSNMVKKEEK